MSTELPTARDIDFQRDDVLGGVVGGLVGGIVFGLMIQFVMGVMPAIGALYGAPGLATGWVAHLFHSAVFGVVYALIADLDAVARYADSWTTGALTGVGYGALIWAVFLVFVWPIWLTAVGFPGAPSVPYLAPKPLVGHLVYGVLLGVTYPLIAEP